MFNQGLAFEFIYCVLTVWPSPICGSRKKKNDTSVQKRNPLQLSFSISGFGNVRIRVTSDQSHRNKGSKNKSTSDHITLASSVGHSTYTHFTLQSYLSTYLHQRSELYTHIHMYTCSPPLHGYLSMSHSAAVRAQQLLNYLFQKKTSDNFVQGKTLLRITYYCVNQNHRDVKRFLAADLHKTCQLPHQV